MMSGHVWVGLGLWKGGLCVCVSLSEFDRQPAFIMIELGT